MLKPFHFLSWTSGLTLKDNCFPVMSLSGEQQNIVLAALESISRDFLDESSSVVEKFLCKAF